MVFNRDDQNMVTQRKKLQYVLHLYAIEILLITLFSTSLFEICLEPDLKYLSSKEYPLFYSIGNLSHSIRVHLYAHNQRYFFKKSHFKLQLSLN